MRERKNKPRNQSVVLYISLLSLPPSGSEPEPPSPTGYARGSTFGLAREREPFVV